MIYLIFFSQIFHYNNFNLNNQKFMTKSQIKLNDLRIEMENIRELYIKGYITKAVYQKETRDIFELASKLGV